MATTVASVRLLAFRSSLVTLPVFSLALDALPIACETLADMTMLARLPCEEARESDRFRVSP
jgi:hypothetical protein